MRLYKRFVKPILFLFYPDHAHAGIVRIGAWLGKVSSTRALLRALFIYQHPLLKTTVCGITFQNPVGLAGGFDKNAELIQTIPCVGFGFTEVGSITHHPYAGNPRPWSVRLKKDKSLIVNYGLKNKGASVLVPRIQAQTRTCPVMVNIAKTNDARIKGDASVADYIASFRLLQDVADMININISCPNTGDGVLFCEDVVLLGKLLNALQAEHSHKPIFLKLKPDISSEMVASVVSLVKEYSCISGFIISNLTRNRNLLKHVASSDIEPYKGGISGQPLKDLSTQMIREVYKLTQGTYPIIGVGGIFSAEDAYEKIRAGASLVELMTGIIYEGPGLIKRINKELVKLLERDGFRSVSDAVGADMR